MIRLEEPRSFWDEDFWERYRRLFQLTQESTPGKMVDISWYTMYLSDGATDVDLDELVRENETINERLRFLTRGKVDRIHRRKKLRSHRKESSASSSIEQKRENHVLGHSVDSDTSFDRFQRVPSRSRESYSKSSETVNGSRVQPLGGFCEEEHFRTRVTKLLRPISLRRLNLGETLPRSTGHLDFEEDTPVRYSREQFRENGDQEWHRQCSTDTEDETLKSPIVSDLVSKFEGVRRRNAFSYGKKKTYDPFSRVEIKANRDKDDGQNRRTIRVISRSSLPLDQTDSRINGSLKQSLNGPSQVYKTPVRTTDISMTNIPLLRTKSESNSRVYPAKLSDFVKSDQLSRSSSEASRLTKAYSVDCGFHTQTPVNLSTTFTKDHVAASSSAASNHSSVVYKLPLINNVDGVNIQKPFSASKTTESLHRNSSRSNFDKSPDTTRKITCSIAKEVDAPSWKAEVEFRRKTKSYVSAHRPEQPIQLGIVPEWKKLLLEKTKQKRNETQTQHDPFSSRLTKQESSINFTEPLWKQEFDKIKRQVAHQGVHQTSYAFERETPEWVKLAEQRRKSRPMTGNDDEY